MSQVASASDNVCLVCCSAAASIYCCQDDASLCKACSAKIHGANLLAARHTLLPFCAVCSAAPSTVYCRADQAFLCSACDTEAHTGFLASRHERIPAAAASKEGAITSSKGIEEVYGESSSGANSEVVGVKEMEQANEFNDLISLGTDFGVVPVFSPQPELPKDELFEKQVFGKDFESLDIDAAWLDRLDMGFDFSDILADNSLPELPCDDAGLVPTLSSSFPEDDFAVPGLSMFEEQTPLFTSFPAAIPEPAEEAPQQAPIRKRKAARRLLEDSDEEVEQEVEEEVQSDDDDYDVPAIKSRKQSRCLVAASARGVVQEAASGVYFQMPAALISVSAAQAAINRAERIAKCRDKRKNRKFEKTIRYATRKAYAEVRPRIKGRFVKKEELEAYRALHGRGMFDPVPTSDEAMVPVM